MPWSRPSTTAGRLDGQVWSCPCFVERRWLSFEAVEMATLEWVDWFNNRRLLEPIGNIPPAEAEALYYAQIDEPAMVA